MKRNILFFALISIFVGFITSCNPDDGEKPSISVDYINNVSSGWFGDTVKFNVKIDCEFDFSLKITNDHDSQSLDENYSAGSTTVEFGYIIPTDLVDGDKIKVTFLATNTESDLSETVEKEVLVSANGSGETIIHEGTITEDQTWYAGDNHVVDGNLYLEGNIITIEPGTVIKMNSGARIYVGNNADANTTLIATGTEEQPITFTSSNVTPAAGDWDFIRFDEGTSSNTELKYCNFEFGGGNVDYYNHVIMVYRSEIKFDNCTIKKSASTGIRVDEGKFISFTNNAITEIEKHLMIMDPNAIHTIGENNIFETTNFGVLVDEDIDFTKDEAIWPNIGVPYFIVGNFYIQSESTSGASLTLAPGVTLAMMEEARIYVGYNETGALIAEGTAELPITFTSGQTTKEAGDWDCIMIEEYSKSSTNFEYCIFEYGGGNDYYNFMVGVYEAETSFSSCTFKHSLNMGLALDETAEMSEFENNSFENCGTYLVHLFPNQIHTLGNTSSFSSDDYGIYVDDSGDYTQTSEKTWYAQDCAYVIDGEITIGTDDGSGAVLRIEEGAIFKFKEDGNIAIGNYRATVYAEGTAENPIVFTSYYSNPLAGQWEGILFHDNTQPGTVFDYCNVSYGGGNDYYKGNICFWETSNATVTNCHISYSANYGIYLNGGEPANTDWQTSNTFENNTDGDWNED